MATSEVITIASQILGRETHLYVIMPQGIQQPQKLLYLLHGNGDDCRSWAENTDIEEYADQYGLAVVMPEVESSYYTDMATGLPYFSYITQELPGIAQQRLGLAPAQTFVGGLSMGGYGALKWVFHYPQMFSGCFSLSGSVDIAARIAMLPEYRLDEFRVIFGQNLVVEPENDLLALSKSAAEQGCTTRIYSACGSEDSFIGFNDTFAAHLAGLPMPSQYHRGRGGHSWSFWRAWLAPALEYILKV